MFLNLIPEILIQVIIFQSGLPLYLVTQHPQTVKQFFMKIPGKAGFVLGLIFSLAASSSLMAQLSAEDSVFYKQAVKNLVEVYKRAAGDQSRLYNGSQYGGYLFSFINGHAFFYDDKPSVGSVLYDGVLYENTALQFDEVQEVLIADSVRRIQLLNDRVERFTLFNNNFVRLVKDTSNLTSPIKTGFYNLLYEGNNTLLKREEKFIREEVSTGELQRFIEIHTFYYLKKGNGYLPLRTRNAILTIFSDKKKEIRQYIRKNKLSYKHDRDNMLIKVTAYYDQLTH